MSSAHDRAQEDVRTLLAALNGAPGFFHEPALEAYREEIENIADYLGVDKEE